MKDGKLSNWVQVAANVGIFAGLVLVALEMQQNSELLRLQLVKEEANNYIASEFSIAGEKYPEVFQKMLSDPENLSLSEMRVLESKLWGHNVQRWLGTYRLYESGLVNESEWKALVNTDVRFAFGNSYSRAWWEVLSAGDILPKEFVEYVDARMVETSDNYTAEFFDSVQKQLRKNQSKQ